MYQTYLWTLNMTLFKLNITQDSVLINYYELNVISLSNCFNDTFCGKNI